MCFKDSEESKFYAWRGYHKDLRTKEYNYVMEIRSNPDVSKASLCRLAEVYAAAEDSDRDAVLREGGNMDELTSSEQVHLEETRALSESDPAFQRTNTLNKMGRSFSFELEEDMNENMFVKISEACKSEAARQSSSLLEVAEGLCNRQSPTSQRKGKVFKKLAPEVEKHLFNEMQRDVCKNMWQEARKRVYGTPSKGTEKSTETVNPPAGHGV